MTYIVIAGLAYAHLENTATLRTYKVSVIIHDVHFIKRGSSNYLDFFSHLASEQVAFHWVFELVLHAPYQYFTVRRATHETRLHSKVQGLLPHPNKGSNRLSMIVLVYFTFANKGIFLINVPQIDFSVHSTSSQDSRISWVEGYLGHAV
jgi:hypothetical protein